MVSGMGDVLVGSAVSLLVITGVGLLPSYTMVNCAAVVLSLPLLSCATPAPISIVTVPLLAGVKIAV